MAVAVVLGAAAACSGDDDPTASERSTTTTAAAGSTSTTAPPTFTGDATSPFCVVLRDADLDSALRGDDADPESVGRAFRAVLDVLGRAAALAPPEIVEDVTLVAEGMDALDAALAAVGYDFDALATSDAADAVVTAVNDPAFADAGVRLAAYRAQVCRL